MDPEDLVDELIEEETSEGADSTKYASLTELINDYLNRPAFSFTVETPGRTAKMRGEIDKLWTIDEIMENEDFSGFISQETRAQYADVIDSQGEDTNTKLSDLFVAVYDDISSGSKQVRIDKGGSFIQPELPVVITYSKKKTDEAGVSYKDHADTLKELDLSTVLLGEAVLDVSETAQDVTQMQGAIRTSHPTWGYKTTKQGTITNSAGEEVPAPFWKGNEYSMFTDMDPSDRFILQQQMVRAGMEAPPVAEYGQWTDREANFMSAVFIKAADDPNFSWEKDLNAGLPAYTTALDTLMQDVGQTEDFIKLLNEANYLQAEPNVTPAQIQQLIDQAAAELGINISAQNYVDYGNLAISAFGQAATLEKTYKDSLINDKDLILGSTFKDVRGVREGEFPRYLKGSTLPLVLPSYEYLQGQKGELPTVKSALEIITEELAKRPEVIGQQASIQDLQDIQYSTNIFEASMGAIELGDD
jgi:hypothetical protein